MAEIRKTKLTLNEILIATERGFRPDQFKSKEKMDCPFCPGNEKLTPDPEILRIPRYGQWLLRCFPNKFPALRIEGNSKFGFLLDGYLASTITDAHGAHEVIIETPVHETDYSIVSPDEIARTLYAIDQRTQDLYRDKRIRYIQVFKNFREEAGASLRHEHTQIIGLPHIPLKLRNRLHNLEDFFCDSNHSIFETVLDYSERDGRIVCQHAHFICICPYEAKLPFEMWIIPVKQTAHFTDSNQHFDDLARIVSESVKRLKAVFGELPPFNMFIEEAPPKIYRDCDSFYCWRLRIMPRLTRIAGFELASGYFINPTPPEQSAKLLKA